MNKRKLVGLLAISIMLSGLAALELPGRDAFSLVRGTDEGIQIRFELPQWKLESIQRDGQTLQRVSVANVQYDFIGEEETLPVFAVMIAIPYTGGVSLSYDQTPSNQRQVLQPEFISALSAERESGKFGARFYPENAVQISEPQVLRDFRVIVLNVRPYQYDTQRGELQVTESLDIRLDFTSGPSINESTPPTSLSPAFENIYKGLILNYNETVGRVGNYHHPRMLVIYGNSSDSVYLGKVDEYVAWKRQKGYVVNAASTAVTGTQNSSIKSYIQNQYNNPDTRPDYIVLIGDTSGNFTIPSYSTYIDYYYTWLAGNDNLGDAVIGRISVETTSQMVNYMAKIQALEKDINPAGSAWLNRMVLAASSTGGTGISPRYTNDYIAERAFDVNPNYTFVKNYASSVPPATTNAAINQGVAFYNFRGWINMDGWTSTINQLNNGNRLFHAVLITCSTGNFDGTDTTEEVIRHGDAATLGGAITAIGMATSSTHTSMNNCLDVGIFHGIYPQGMRNMGEAMLNGKLYLYTIYGLNYPEEAYNFSGYCNLMGDPTAVVYVGIPSVFSVDAASTLPAGSSHYQVNVKDQHGMPVENASVSITNTAGQQALHFTDSAGNALLELNPALSGSLTLTVDKNDFKPYIQNVNILSSGGLVYDGMDIDDSIGNGNGDADAGETLDIYIGLRNTSNMALTPSATVSCNDPWVTLINYDRIEYERIQPNSSDTNLNPVTLSIDPACPDGRQIVLNYLLETTAGSYETLVPIIVNNGRLELQAITFSGSSGNLLNPGDNWPVVFTLKNTGGANLNGLSASLSSQDNFLQVTDASGWFGNIPIGSTTSSSSDVFGVHALSSCVNGMVIPMELELSNSAGFQQTIPFTFTIGDVSVTDPLGQDAYGYFIYDDGDEAYDLCPVYNWIPIAPGEGGLGTALNLVDPYASSNEGDQTSANSIQTVDLPFGFTIYGVEYNRISISSNGFIAFGESTDSDWRNWRLPGPGGPSPMVAVFWDDLAIIPNQSAVCTWYNQAQHYFVVEWYNMVSGYDGNTPETFQAILYDPVYYPSHTDDGQIKLQYKQFNNVDLGAGSGRPHGNFCTIGIEDHSGTVGLEYTFGNIYPTAAKPLSHESALLISTRAHMPDIPYLVVEAAQVVDPNQNGFLEPGEAAQLALRLGNRGLVDATGVSAILSSSDPYVTITNNSASFGTVPSLGNTMSLSNYAVQVAPNCPPDRRLNFNLAISANNGNWQRSFYLDVVIPEFDFQNLRVLDQSGNHNGILDPGESVTVKVDLHNIGRIPTPAGTTTLVCSTPGISITNPNAAFPAMSPGEHSILDFDVTAAASVANGTLVSFYFSLSAEGITASESFVVEVGAPLEVFIGTGAGSQRYPLDCYYYYSVHEAIYLMSEIEFPGIIKSLAFHKAEGSDTSTIDNVSIYMKLTNSSTLSTGTYSTNGYTLVYSGSFPNNGTSGWQEVELDDMFLYDASGNLSILTVKDHQQWISNYPQWSYTNTGNNRARQYSSDSSLPSSLTASNYLPNLRLKMFPNMDMLMPPRNLTAISSHGYVRLEWDAPVGRTPDHYAIYRNRSLFATSTNLFYRDEDVIDGTEYHYWITAVFDGVESEPTESVTATPNAYPPSSLIAVAGNNRVTLNWIAAQGRASSVLSEKKEAQREISAYRVYRNGSPIATVDGVTYLDTGVVNGQTYQYYVTTVYTSPAGESGHSNVVAVIPASITDAVLGNGTSSTGNSAASPINVWYKSLHGQSVYTKAELNAAGIMGPHVITHIGFNVTGLPERVMPNYVVRMGHTNATNASSWIPLYEMEQVFHLASYQPSSTGWNMLPLSQAFVWNGVDNIVVDTAFGLVASYSSTGTVQYTNMSNGYRYNWNDSSDQSNNFSGGSTSNYRPNLKLQLSPYIMVLDAPTITIQLNGQRPVLNWQAVPNADSYQVWSADSPDGNYQLLQTQQGISFEDRRGLSKAFYQVKAISN